MSERRSHAERTAETRGRIIRAVIESIADVGFQRTTAAEIARRSGLTWGAVQHHFGGKDGILLAVIESSFAHFAERLEDVPTEDLPLEKRVSRFVDGAWEHFSSDRYRSTFEILLDQATRDPDVERPWQAGMLEAFDRVWRRFFADCALPRRRSLELQHYTIAVLSGLASMLVLEGGGARVRPSELDLLKDTLFRSLSGEGRA